MSDSPQAFSERLYNLLSNVFLNNRHIYDIIYIYRNRERLRSILFFDFRARDPLTGHPSGVRMSPGKPIGSREGQSSMERIIGK